MSHNTDPERAARRHPAPILAIILALAVAGIALIWWIGADPAAEDDLNRSVESTIGEGSSNAKTTSSESSGTVGSATTPSN